MALAPSFRASFIAETAWAPDPSRCSDDGPIDIRMHGSRILGSGGAAENGQRAGGRPLLLPQLDLAALAGRDEPPPSESVMKRAKLALFERQCSKVCEGLYVAGEAVAKSRAALRDNGITHVVNCVGAMYPEYWRADGVEYMTLWLQGELRDCCAWKYGAHRLSAGRNRRSGEAAVAPQSPQHAPSLN